jgi:hypothetical protein
MLQTSSYLNRRKLYFEIAKENIKLYTEKGLFYPILITQPAGY